jgi:hypothetical protein
MPLSGIMTERISWESSFYFYGSSFYFSYLNSFQIEFLFSSHLFSGVVGVIWFVIWWFYSYERPANCNTITEQERIYIEEAIGETSSLATKVSSH